MCMWMSLTTQKQDDNKNATQILNDSLHLLFPGHQGNRSQKMLVVILNFVTFLLVESH